ncbi:MAG: ABC transporter substrate-binding protein [Aggregatilineales bacterium]
MKTVKTFGLLVVVVLWLGLSAQAGQAQATQPADQKVTIRLGYVPVLIYAPLYVAMERGYFAQEGLDVQLTPLQGGSDSVVQLAAGNFDAAVGGIGAGLLNAANKGLDFRIVAPMHSERPPVATPLVIAASRADEIKTIADLKGKTVAINATGAATEYWLYEALAEGGLTFNDVKLTTVAFKDVPIALQTGAIDAAMLGEPLVTLQIKQGVVKVLANDFIHGFVSTYLYMGLPLLHDHPQAAEGFVRAYLRASRDLQGEAIKDPTIAAIIEKYTKVPAAVVEQASHAYYDPNGTIPLSDINTLQAYFLTRGELEYKTPLDLSKYVDTSLVDQAIKDLGVYAVPTAVATQAAN